ncbi:nuclease [Asaia siamensis]
MIRRSLCAVSALFTVTLVTSFSGQALAWGPYGHAIVADIAQSRLTPQATSAVTRLLALENHQTLAQVASWPDTIGHVPKDKGGLPQTLPWHYVDTDAKFATYDLARDCGNDICVTEKLPEMEKILADPKAAAADRLVALKWIVHLAGDLHQPLHAAERDHDKGGNMVKVSYFGQNRDGHENLHSLWDEGIMDHERHLVVGPHYSIDFTRAREEADRLNAQITPGQAAFWTGDFSAGTVHDSVVKWTDESHALARDVAYGALPAGRKKDLGEAYTAIAFPVIETRLQQAGVRLADLINTAFPTP